MRKKLRIILSIFMLIAFFMSLQSCGYKNSSSTPAPNNTNTGAGNPDPQPTQKISFVQVNQTVLAPKCLRCHSSAGGNKGGINLETYQNTFNLKDIVKSEVESRSMPLGDSLTNEQINLIIDWINSGAPELATKNLAALTDFSTDLTFISSGSVTTSGTVTTSGVVIVEPLPKTYQDLRQSLFQPNCFKCHSDAGGNRAGINLETYATAIAVLDSMKLAIETNTMPPKPPRGIPLTDEQKNDFANWIANGAKEN